MSGLVAGAIVERLLIRPVESEPPLNAVIVTFGLLLFLEAVAGMVWGETSRGFPSQFSIHGLHVGTQAIALSPFDLFVHRRGGDDDDRCCSCCSERRTSGCEMRAAAFRPEVSRLLGVQRRSDAHPGLGARRRMVGALAGVLIAPKVFLSPNMMDCAVRLRVRRRHHRWPRQPDRRGGRRSGARPRDELRGWLVCARAEPRGDGRFRALDRGLDGQT